MKEQLIPASRGHGKVIKNLMQFYIYDFTEFVAADVVPMACLKLIPNLIILERGQPTVSIYYKER